MESSEKKEMTYEKEEEEEVNEFLKELEEEWEK